MQFSTRFLLCTLVLFCQTVFVTGAASPAPVSDSQDPPITHEVYLEVSHGKEPLGTIVVGLFGTVVPKSVKNFVTLVEGFNDISYNGSIFHRVIKNFMIQGGDFEYGKGIGGYSIYGKHFPDENFDISFDKPGYIAYANSGKDTNGSQFFITTVVTNWLSGAHVIFGKLIGGSTVVKAVEEVPTGLQDRPIEPVTITGAYVIEKRQGDENDQSKEELGVEDPPAQNIDDENPPRSHTGWLFFFLFVFAAASLYGLRVRHLQNKEIIEEIEFHRI